ncbi:hypothetical protein HK099_003966 [Clydaea vesicula]|uniref:mRNA 3'-end-processing protein n=1 Tax=Clydaea vesicula TaxID=447962 RepID=A0AAD5Y3K3_9FUNG|nr:hypothetical protein HK099_003966 [Clydaea vesicula]
MNQISLRNFSDFNLIDSSYIFEFENFIKNDLKIKIEKQQIQPVCQAYLRGNCLKGNNCPNKHTFEKSVVCKHYLRGLCKKGEQCEFLHEYNMKKMPEYLHIDPNLKIKDCPWYARGFCKHGGHCKNKHVRMAVCQLYLTGFCPKGLDCEKGHPKYELPPSEEENHSNSHFQQGAATSGTSGGNNFGKFQQFNGEFVKKDLKDVVCFKCGEKGHFATVCPKRRQG